MKLTSTLSVNEVFKDLDTEPKGYTVNLYRNTRGSGQMDFK